jgi:hypothetical protein
MARSLARNTKVFASSLTKANLTTGNMTDQNTFELKVLDGYSFSQDVASQEIGVNEADSEAGCASLGLARGTLAFNTALNPVDVSFSTYVRPYQNSLETDGGDTGSTGDWTDCVERILWACAMGSTASWTTVTSTGAAAGEVIESQTASTIQFGLGKSNVNELLPLTLCFVLENATYVIEQFNVGTAEVDFSIDGIATINWSGTGSRVNEDENVHNILKTGGTGTAGTHWQSVPATTTTTFLRNKLSTLELKNNEGVKTTGDASGTLTSISSQTITTDMDLSAYTGDDTLVGGRIYSADDDAWAAIIAHTTTGTNDTVTVSSADDISTWDDALPNDLDVFKPGSHAAIEYCIPITGGTLSLENNITYLTPEELAIVNLPLAGFAGNRVTSGNFTAYLNTGAQGSAGLLQDLLAKIEESVSNNYELKLHMGNASTATPRVDFTIAHAQVGIPTTNVEDIISTEVSFSAKPWDTGNDVASFEDTNELVINYYD